MVDETGSCSRGQYCTRPKSVIEAFTILVFFVVVVVVFNVYKCKILHVDVHILLDPKKIFKKGLHCIFQKVFISAK